MSAIGKNNLRLGERLPQIYGGRNIETFPNYKPSRVLRPSVPPISGYDAWYDPSDLSTLTHLAGRVSAITDKGSGANNLSATGSPG